MISKEIGVPETRGTDLVAMNRGMPLNLAKLKKRCLARLCDSTHAGSVESGPIGSITGGTLLCGQTTAQLERHGGWQFSSPSQYRRQLALCGTASAPLVDPRRAAQTS